MSKPHPSTSRPRPHERPARPHERTRRAPRPAPHAEPTSVETRRQHPAPTFARSLALVTAGAALSVLIVTAPVASGGLLEVVRAAAAGDPRRAARGVHVAQAWVTGLAAWIGALAYMLPGPLVFGVAAWWAYGSRSMSPDAREAAFWAMATAGMVYVYAASALAMAAVVDFAVRRRLPSMFDVGDLVDRLIRRPGFGAMWLKTAALMTLAYLGGLLAWWASGLAIAGLAVGSGLAFLLQVPAAFMWGDFARRSYGLLACVPEAEAPAPPASSPASLPGA